MTQRTPQAGPRKGEPAAEVFSQFAWHLAGTLAKTTTAERKPRPPRRPRPVATR